MTITNNGRKLADSLGQYVGWTNGISTTCSAITRAARSYCTIQERFCSEDMSDATREALEAREERREAKLASLVQDLPHTDEGPFVLRLQGDPRGHTVRLVAPDGREIGCDL